MAEDGSRDAAKRIADEVAPLIKLARSRRFDFLAYLLAMALKESRRLSGQKAQDASLARTRATAKPC